MLEVVELGLAGLDQIDNRSHRIPKCIDFGMGCSSQIRRQGSIVGIERHKFGATDNLMSDNKDTLRSPVHYRSQDQQLFVHNKSCLRFDNLFAHRLGQSGIWQDKVGRLRQKDPEMRKAISK